MSEVISIQYPDSLALSLKMKDREFKDEMKRLSLIKLYELGKISSGTVAELLEISRIDFLEMLGKYNVSYFGNKSISELESDVANA
ncbi:UPF0175 family protein [Petrimonas sp.]|uniref:UPF0175 family protein n=1 Tax=Petrimonas sp. TaxID=2023866 RepID=UPI003F50EB08